MCTFNGRPASNQVVQNAARAPVVRQDACKESMHIPTHPHPHTVHVPKIDPILLERCPPHPLPEIRKTLPTQRICSKTLDGFLSTLSPPRQKLTPPSKPTTNNHQPTTNNQQPTTNPKHCDASLTAPYIDDVIIARYILITPLVFGPYYAHVAGAGLDADEQGQKTNLGFAIALSLMISMAMQGWSKKSIFRS